MLYDTLHPSDCLSSYEDSLLPEYQVERYTSMSAIIEDEALLSGARESALPFFVSSGDLKVRAIVFEPLKGFYLGICGPVPILCQHEAPFFCDLPYSMFMLLLKGRYVCTAGKDEQARFEMGDSYFMAGDWHGMHGKCYVDKQEAWCHVAIAVSPEVVREHFGPSLAEDMQRILHWQENGAPRGIPVVTALASPDLVSSGRRLVAMRKEGPLDVMELRSASFDFFARMLRNAASCSPSPLMTLPDHDVRALTRLKERIEKNCLENTTVEELCVFVGMSESKANKAFKQLFNITIARHVHNCKLQYAHAMLSSRKRNVSECALEIGYTNIGHFIAAYRKHYGNTPGSTFRQAS